MTSIRLNLVSNIVAAAYLALISLIFLPKFLEQLGSLQFGLIAFHTVIYGTSHLLDMGMSPLMGREAASLRHSEHGPQMFARVLRTLEFAALLIVALVTGVFWAGSDFFLLDWLNLSTEESGGLNGSVIAIGLVAGLRPWCSLYKSALKGLERQLTLNLILILVGTIRFPITLLFIVTTTGSIGTYFEMQVFASLLELVVLGLLVYTSVPACRRVGVRPYPAQLRPKLRFSLGVAYASFVWVLLTQMDKLMLSNALEVDMFGYFVLASTLCGGILLLATPVTDAVLPRLVSHHTVGNSKAERSLYLRATTYLACLAFSAAAVLSVYARDVVWLWTANSSASDATSNLIPLLAYGTAFAAVSGMLFQLQVAHGNLRMHTIYNSILILIQLPALYFGILYYGAYGAAVAWLGIRAISLAVWTPYVHATLLPGAHVDWILRAVLLPLTVSALTALGYVALTRAIFDGTTSNQLLPIVLGSAVTLLTTGSVARWAEPRYGFARNATGRQS